MLDTASRLRQREGYVRRTLGLLAWAALLGIAATCPTAYADLRAGVSAVDITPQEFPVIRNGGFLEAQDNRVADPLFARCLVLDDGKTQLALLIVDSCMIPRELCDEVKQRAAEATGMVPNRILIAATHTHSAPSVMDHCLGSRADAKYTAWLPSQLVRAIRQAYEARVPAEAGWAAIETEGYTNCRRWITRPDTMLPDPFGELTVRANMHPGHESADFTGPSGPADPWLTVLSVRTRDGQPLSLLANFSMHYFGGHPGLSSDYFGRFAQEIKRRLAVEDTLFVGIMSQGTSGDLWWGDYAQPRQARALDEYAQGLADIAQALYAGIEHHADVPLDMAERRVTFRRRTPDAQRLAWAHRMRQQQMTPQPGSRPEVYAQQAFYLAENPTCEVVLQAMRIGELGITALPNEVYGITGLKLKYGSPFAVTMNVSLANGASGYIPPPEQHRLGGYNTWPARTAGLEEQAEPAMVEHLVEMLAQLRGQPAREFRETLGPAARRTLDRAPWAYYRMAELSGEIAWDASGHGRHAIYRDLFAFHLPGVPGHDFTTGTVNRAAHCVGGRLEIPWLAAAVPVTVELWFWNGMVPDARGVTGTLVSRGPNVWQIAGKDSERPGCLQFGDRLGSVSVGRYTWNHLVVSDDGQGNVRCTLNGQLEESLSGDGIAAPIDEPTPLVVGASPDDSANFEGRLDEIVVWSAMAE